ncbi:MAG: TolC family protein [Chthonomonadales bacterium]
MSILRAVQTGLRESLLGQAALADVRAAEADTRVARSAIQPQVSANTYATYGNTANILGSSPGVTPGNLMSVFRNGYADQNLTAMVPLYTGGRLGSLIRVASARGRAVSADYGEVQSEVAYRVREAYYRALLAAEFESAAQSRLDYATALLKTTQAQVDAGKGIEASVSRVAAEVSDGQRAITSARNDRAKSLLDLKAAMGVRLDSDITLSDTLVYQPITGEVSTAIKEALKNRPELKALRNRLAAAESQTSASEGSFKPQIYGTVMTDALASGGRSYGTYTIGMTLSLPLVDGGQRRAETDKTRAMKVRIELELREAELRVAKEVQQAWLDQETGVQNYQTAEAALKAAQAAYDVTAIRVQSQKAILVELLDALAALNQARASVAASLFDYSIADAHLNRALGKV